MKPQTRDTESANGVIVFGFTLLVLALIIWGMWWGFPLYPEEKIIEVTSVNYHTRATSDTTVYTEIRISDREKKEYVYSMTKHIINNPMFAQINNGWNFPHEQTIEKGGKYKITLWHSIFMGRHVTDNFSNWNPNPEISKIVRLD